MHVHPRDSDGHQSLEDGPTRAALEAIRARVPDILIGISTAWPILPDADERRAAIASWSYLPDYVSVNLQENDAADVIRQVLERGIDVEAGLWSVADAQRFIQLGEWSACKRILIEINEQGIEAGRRAVRDILALLEENAVDLPILLHGYDATVWPIYEDSLKHGFDARIGLEDGCLLPSGDVCDCNHALIQQAVRIANENISGRASR